MAKFVIGYGPSDDEFNLGVDVILDLDMCYEDAWADQVAIITPHLPVGQMVRRIRLLGVTPSTYPGLWSVCSLVSVSMGQSPQDEYHPFILHSNADLDLLSRAEEDISALTFRQVLIIAGIVEDEIHKSFMSVRLITVLRDLLNM